MINYSKKTTTELLSGLVWLDLPNRLKEIFNRTSGGSYKVYTALLTQTGTDAPTAIVVENTLGTITFGYVSTGLYSINSPGLFITNKTVAFLGATPSGSIIKTELISSNTVNIGANDGDDEMEKTAIEIRVYN